MSETRSKPIALLFLYLLVLETANIEHLLAGFIVVGILQFETNRPHNKEVIGVEVSTPEDADI